MVPKFKTISRGEGERPVVEYYDGKEEVLRAARNIFSENDKEEYIYAIYPRDEVEENFSQKDLESIRNSRINRNIRSKTIYSYKKGEYKPDNTGDRIRVDGKEYPIKAEINIYEDRVRINTMGKRFGSIFIKSRDVADTMKTLFELAFKKIDK